MSFTSLFSNCLLWIVLGSLGTGLDSRTHELDDEAHDFRVLYESVRSPCHAEGRAVECMPPFTNMAEGSHVDATSTCGQNDKTERFCTTRISPTGRKQLHCESCTPPERYHTRLLTDRHQMNNETYWVSGPVHAGETVNLTLSLGKTFEVYYVSLQPFGRLPDAITLSKSSDFGVTWRPWQYFSTDCYKAFRLPTSNEHNAQISVANIQEVLCVALKSPEQQDQAGHHGNVVAFSTTIGRPSSQPWSAALIDWMTMTDLRVSLSRFPNQPDPMQHDENGLLLTPNLLSQSTTIFRVGDVSHSKYSAGTLGMSRHPFQSDRVGLDNEKWVNFALSDLAIGGRCKCNGHSNRCVRDRLVDPAQLGDPGETKWGPLRCDCQHNTAGNDCERCAPGYLDRPWARASMESANECKRCDCNLHSALCVFSQQIFLTSQKVSGGVCQDCQHNTVGRRCHHCASGYYRDWTKPVSHDQVCLECRCHPIGSIPDTPCDRKTGQCVCKPGVTGQACNRCQDGYKQTRLSDQPCVRVVEQFAHRKKSAPVPNAVRTAHAMPPESKKFEPHEFDCQPCKPHKKRIRFKKFCRREAVFLGVAESYNPEDDKIRFNVRIRETWRIDGAAERLLPKKASPNLPPFPVWIRNQATKAADIRGAKKFCFCPEIKTGQPYLFLTHSYQIPHGNRMDLLLDASSIVLPWRESWRRRLNKFVRRAAKGRCDAMQGPDEKENEEDGVQIRRAQKLQNTPGHYASTYHHNRPISDDPWRYVQAQPAAPEVRQAFRPAKFYQIQPVGTSSTQRGYQASSPHYTYYNPYIGYQDALKH